MNVGVTGALVAGAAGLAAGLVAAPWYYQPRPLTQAMQRAWPDVVFEVETHEPVFALTFDDGPHDPYTGEVLDILDEFDATATFFVMGQQVERNPHLVERIAHDGHEVGNHFYDGRLAMLMSDEEAIASLEHTERLVAPFAETHLARPASGAARATTREAMRERGYTTVLGSAYTSDCTHPPRAYMRWAFRQMLEPGRILILHDGRRQRQRTVDVLPDILRSAGAQGLRAVSVSELLASGDPASPGAPTAG
jgi:peptidoglycan-N-acetylglucosamine deacetylase